MRCPYCNEEINYEPDSPLVPYEFNVFTMERDRFIVYFCPLCYMKLERKDIDFEEK
jgi:hypothetical protein